MLSALVKTLNIIQVIIGGFETLYKVQPYDAPPSEKFTALSWGNHTQAPIDISLSLIGWERTNLYWKENILY